MSDLQAGVERTLERMRARRTDPYLRERNQFWGKTYHIRLSGGGSKEQARRYACAETLRKYGSTPFAKDGDPQP